MRFSKVNSVEIRIYRLADPYATLEEIGLVFGVTKERVRQILKRAGLPTKHLYDYPQHECLNCHRLFGSYALRNRTFCSDSCRWQYCYPLVKCDFCHIFFRRRRSYVERTKKRAGRIYCSQRCFGKWFAEHYGFVPFPEHAGRLRIKAH